MAGGLVQILQTYARRVLLIVMVMYTVSECSRNYMDWLLGHNLPPSASMGLGSRDDAMSCDGMGHGSE
ncbi:hypothetical protein TNCV_4686391 [Trichonephila clavipes]|nr:hypothetical protein TNCV_4686391 [Trichonephila clavipes]